MRKLLAWLDENLLFLLTGFLLAFIPLFPKLPLFEVLPGYIVRVRLEDFIIAGTLIIWLIQLWRKKVSFGPNPLARPVLAYLTIGILSMISAVFIIRTVPQEALHINKMVLHFLRRVEYFSLFFVFYSTVKSIKQVKTYLIILLATIVGVTLYGYGQKYLYWPAFSTMNREFAKGWALYLTEHARVLSTFGGHYDLAAFMMMALILLWALFFLVDNLWQKAAVAVILAGAFWLLILTASRTSFLAYLAGVTVLFAILAFKNGINKSLKHWLVVTVLSIVVMLSFGDLSDRFTKLLKLDQRIGGIKSILLRPLGKPPAGENVVLLENNLAAVTSKSDQPPSLTRPTDVYEDIPLNIATDSGETITTYRTYSRTALVYDLSTGIRLDALWPRAIAGFKRNPLLGSGYSTLTKTQIEEFTEAESTDNDFLRALGETGILGFLAFGWILLAIFYTIWTKFLLIKDKTLLALAVTLTAVVAGLLVNAVYIDVFEASKVAFIFWAFTGVVLGGVKSLKLKETKPILKNIPGFAKDWTRVRQIFHRVKQSDRTYLILILILAFGLRLYKISTPLADWHSWRQADTSAVTRNFIRYGIDPLYPRYDDLSKTASGFPNPQGYRFVEFPLYNIIAVFVDKIFTGYNIEISGRLTSIFMSLGSIIFLYLLVKKYYGRQIALWSIFFLAVIPYNIYWSRTILPEPTLVFLTTGLVFWFDRYLDSQKTRHYILALLFAQAALLVKFSAAFFVVPLTYLVFRKWGGGLFKKWQLYLFAGLSVVPFGLWRWHVSRYPEGIPAFMWLLNGNGIRFKGSWWWWLFAERISKLILGGWGVVLFILGLTTYYINQNQILNKLIQKVKNKSLSWLFYFWALGMFVYLVVFATGNVQHDYYQIILVPILAVFMGKGAHILWSNYKQVFHPWLSKLLLAFVILFMLMFGWYQVRDFYNINHPEIVEAGGRLDRLVPNKRVLVVAPYNGDTAFLYQTGRRGWPIVEGTLEEMIDKGADYYVSVNFDALTRDLIKITREVELGIDKTHPYKLVELTDQYAIIQLVPNKELPAENP